jgi:hypothetical protein
MKWTVVWKPSIQQELAALYLVAPDRATLTAAANTIDFLLAHNPLGQGEEREEGHRLLMVPPLAVRYTVDPGDCKVTVYAVWTVKA